MGLDLFNRIASGTAGASYMATFLSPLDPRKLALLQRTSRVISAVVIAVGLVVLYGWLAHIPALLSVLPGLVSMKANTAISIVCCGASLLISTWNWKSGACPPPWRAAAFGIAFVAFLI